MRLATGLASCLARSPESSAGAGADRAGKVTVSCCCAAAPARPPRTIATGANAPSARVALTARLRKAVPSRRTTAVAMDTAALVSVLKRGSKDRITKETSGHTPARAVTRIEAYLLVLIRH